MRVQAIASGIASGQAGSPAAARTEMLVAALMAGLLGMLVIWGVGFSPIAALHNAAHDTRHSMAFPCH
jgi:cobalt transporter subunit CbtB